TGKEVISIESAALGYKDKLILRDVTLRLLRGHHWGIVGVNGAGKSTLLKTLAQKLPLLTGSYKLGYQVQISYFAQHVTDELMLNETVLEALQRMAHPACSRQEILNMAGSFLFSGDEVHKPIRVLSGGEKSRVALGQILLKKSPVLVLDEPTNHLDFDTVEALTLALSDYSGTLIVVSHDRSFIGRVSKQILEVAQGEVKFYPGTYDEYLWSLSRGSYGQENDDKLEDKNKINKKVDEKKVKSKEVQAFESPKQLKFEIQKLEKTIKNYEIQLKQFCQLRDIATEKLITAKGELASNLSKEIHHHVQEIEKTEELLLHLMESLELLQTQFQKI
ncbi:MAG TPA: ATP-binding cassette domain-containing protein, partial [Pseudobdellovibrionaceae bacterium]|nr:ATP-binding cassette domain-containing protein [Pseudobdellovibrionaceae bacterium]